MTVSGRISWILAIDSFRHRSQASMAQILSSILTAIGEQADFMIVTSLQCRDSAIDFNAGNHCAACESPKSTIVDSGWEISPKKHSFGVDSFQASVHPSA